MRHRGAEKHGRFTGLIAMAALVVLLPAMPARAQTPPAPAVSQTTADSLQPPLSPGRAFLYSLALPGLGQSRLRRHMPGTLYFAIEAVAVAMLLKSANDLRVARAGREHEVINAYQVDANGAPIIDGSGQFVPLDTARSRYTDERVRARRTHVEDWVAILVANHLFAGADAFVASLLWDVPARLGARALPQGRVGLGLTVRW